MKVGVIVFLLVHIELSSAANFNNPKFSDTSTMDKAHYELEEINEIPRREKRQLVSPFKGQIDELKKKINELEQQLKYLNESHSAEEKNLKNRIAALQEEVVRLKEDLANQSQVSEAKLAEFRQLLEDLNAQINRLTRRILPDDCYRHVVARDFTAALKDMQLINDEYENQEVILRVFGRQAERIDLLIDFQKSIPLDVNKELAMLVYTALVEDIRRIRDDDVLQLTKLVDALHYFANKCRDGRIQHLINKVMAVIQQMAQRILKTAMFESKYVPNKLVTDVSVFLRGIHFANNTNFFEGMIDLVINDVYGRVNSFEILRNLRGHEHILERMAGFGSVFHKLESEGHLYTSAAFKLAEYIKEIVEWKDYNNSFSLAPANREKFNVVKDGLPDLVKVSVFSKNICLRDVQYNQYVNVASGSCGTNRHCLYALGHDAQRSHDGHDEHWSIEPQPNGNFKIRSKERNGNEYMLMADYYPGSTTKRHMYSDFSTDVNGNEWEVIHDPAKGTAFKSAYFRQFYLWSSPEVINGFRLVQGIHQDEAKERNHYYTVVDCS